MGRKCAVEGCLSDSNRPEDTGVTFHKVPMHNDIRPKWLSLCRIPSDKKNMKVIYICSRHFLRIDFCNFKGKKYMLRQGVLPSVFPWDKSKLEAIKVKSEKAPEKKEEIETEVKTEPGEAVEQEKEEVETPVKIKTETEEIPDKNSKETGPKDKIKMNVNGPINFAINSRIEALDNNNIWYPAKIVEEDYEENEVLIHFEKFSSKFDEWICMDSPRLRPLQPQSSKSGPEQYTVGERCLATWSDARKFPATITKVLSDGRSSGVVELNLIKCLLSDSYEVLFDDGFVKNLKAHRIFKSEGRPIQSSPLFDPIQSTKQERREKKRKINIAQLFGKRPRLEHTEIEKPKIQNTTQIHTVTSDEVFEPWVPQ